MVENTEFCDFFIDQLKDVYWAEKALYKVLPQLRDAASNKKLSKAIDKHLQDTENQIEMLKEVFLLLDCKAQAKKCDAMDGLVKEAESVIEDTQRDSYTRDAALIMACQKAEHYEIATYGTLAVFARHMGEDGVADILQQILDNEKATDVELTIIAEEYINASAVKE